MTKIITRLQTRTQYPLAVLIAIVPVTAGVIPGSAKRDDYE